MEDGMRSRIGMAVVLICFLLALDGASLAANKEKAPQIPFRGTRWNITVTPDAEAAKKGEKPFQDTLSFEGDVVRLDASEARGFQPSTYTATRVKGGGWAFNTTQRSQKHGDAFWQARIQGDTMRGEMRVLRRGGTALHYSFQGVKVKEQGGR
jgi:hypothetical protein